MSFSKTRVGVLRGGKSSEYEVSLQSGATMLEHLPREHYEPIDVFIDREGVWYQGGVPREPSQIIQALDVALLALHGENGEDGVTQRFLDTFSVPYTGSDSFASALGMNKAIAKEYFQRAGIKTPLATLVSADENLDARTRELFFSFPQPSVIKPVSCGSSVGVSIAQTIPQIRAALARALSYGHAALIEEYITGREATCGVIDNFRGMHPYALPPIEIIPPAHRTFFDYDAKYTGVSQEICPGRFDKETKREIERIAAAAHKSLGLRHYSRADFIVSPRRGVYLLEVNTLPGMTTESLFPKALAAVGSSIGEFLDHIISLALRSTTYHRQSSHK